MTQNSLSVVSDSQGRIQDMVCGSRGISF